MMEMLLLWSLAPAFLVFSGGMLVSRAWPEPEGRPYFAFYLLGVAAVILSVHASVSLLVDHSGTSQIGRVVFTLLPAAVGALGLLLFHLRDLWRLSPVLRAVSLLFVIIAISSVIPRFGIFLEHLLPAVFALGLALWLAKSGGRFLILFFLISVAFLAFMNSGGMESMFELLRSLDPGPWIYFPLSILFLSASPIVVGLAAAFCYRGIRSNANTPDNLPAGIKAGHLIMAVFLLGYLAYTIFWASVWDRTSDGLGGLFISFSASITVVAAAMVLAFSLAGWRRLSGAAFGFLGIPLLFFAFNRGWDVSYHDLTENRAERIGQALERYYTANRHYPGDLGGLTPRFLLHVPEPMILRNVGWCYRSGESYYQLGTFHREFFGMPTSFRLYAHEGEAPDDWACEEKLEYVQTRYQSAPMYNPEEASQFGPPTPEPLPHSQPSIGRQTVAPFFSGERVMPGRWSMDDRYLTFSANEGQPPLSTHLYVYDAQSEEVCRTGEAYFSQGHLYSQHVWLPGGSLFYIDTVGQPYLLEPCIQSHTSLAGLFGEAASREWGEAVPQSIPTSVPMLVFEPTSGKILIEVEGRFWMLEPELRKAAVLEGVTPNPFDLHWDNAEFSPNGARLAISRIAGRDGRGGSTLFILDAGTLDIQREVHLAYASRQAAPLVRWMSEYELAIRSENVYAILDLSTDPPTETRVIEDIFGLGLRYPNETSSSASIRLDDGTYRIGLRANHPRNKAIYLYRSESKQIQTFQAEEDVILIFDGEWALLPDFENAVENRDNLLVFWPDPPDREPVLIEVDGHTPRSYAHLRVELLLERGIAVISSSQGVSLHDINSGRTLAFYGLVGDPGSIEVYGRAAPGEAALVVHANGGGLYRIPLP
jgi:hypothetical protein